jgi:hypothetical protein
MSVSGRTVWWAKDAGWYRRAAVIKLKRKHGPLGLVVVDWLTCEAKSQDDGGWVKSGVEAVADGIGSDDVQVRPVLSDASAFGVLDDYEDHGETFTCRISGWHEEQERVADAQRKRAERAAARKKPMNTGPPESERPVLSGSVRERPEMSPTGQDRTGLQTTPLPPKGESSGLVVPVRPSGGRRRDLGEYDREVEVFAVALLPNAEPVAATAAVRSVLGRGHGFHGGDVDTVRQAALKYLPLRGAA